MRTKEIRGKYNIFEEQDRIFGPYRFQMIYAYSYQG